MCKALFLLPRKHNTWITFHITLEWPFTLNFESLSPSKNHTFEVSPDMPNTGFETEKKNVRDNEKCTSLSREFYKIIFMIRNNLLMGNEMPVTRKFNISPNNLSCELLTNLKALDQPSPRAMWCRKPCVHVADEDVSSRDPNHHSLQYSPICSLRHLLLQEKTSPLPAWRDRGVRSGFLELDRTSSAGSRGNKTQPKGIKKAKGNTRAKPNESCQLGFSSEMLIRT